jgi:ketosteroid isomerase-like protein
MEESNRGWPTTGYCESRELFAWESYMDAETEAVKETYAALNRGDIAGFVSVFDPQVERTEHFPTGGGTYRGLAEVTAYSSKARGTWAEGSCEPERFVVVGNRVIVFVHVRVRLKSEAEWREGRVVDVFTFRNGKAIEFHSFVDEREALEWAGVGAADGD